MDKLLAIMKRKPSIFLVLSLGYIILVGLVKWKIHPPVGALWFVAGGLIGVYFLDAAEVFFALNPSPFRSVIFSAALAIVSLFVLTSSGSLVSQGLVLSLYLTLILWQIGQWQYVGNITDWYRMISTPVRPSLQRWGIILFILIYLVETALFIAWA